MSMIQYWVAALMVGLGGMGSPRNLGKFVLGGKQTDYSGDNGIQGASLGVSAPRCSNVTSCAYAR